MNLSQEAVKISDLMRQRKLLELQSALEGRMWIDPIAAWISQKSIEFNIPLKIRGCELESGTMSFEFGVFFEHPQFKTPDELVVRLIQMSGELKLMSEHIGNKSFRCSRVEASSLNNNAMYLSGVAESLVASTGYALSCECAREIQ